MGISATTGSTASNSTAATSLAFAAISLTNSQFLVVCVSMPNTTTSVSSITDTGGNTYTFRGAKNNSGNTVRSEIWTAPVTSATGNQTITVNFSAATLASAAFEEYAGVSALGNIGTGAAGTGFYPEADVATQDGNNWSVCCISAATNSGDTFTADLGTIRQSVIPALTTAATGLIDNSSVTVVGALRNGISLSASRDWSAIALELRSGGGSIVVDASSVNTPISNANAGTKHQLVKAPPSTGGGGGSTQVWPIAAELEIAFLGQAYSETIGAVGGTSPYTFAVSGGTLPTGLSLAGTGLISGTPSATGSYSFGVSATDHNGVVGAYTFEIVAEFPPFYIASLQMRDGFAQQAYTDTLEALGGTSPYNFTVTSGSLPAGLSLNSATGVVSGSPTHQGTSMFSVTVTDSYGNTASSTFTMNIFSKGGSWAGG